MARSPAARKLMGRAANPPRLAAIRAANQLLHRPQSVSHPADVARAVCGLQNQDMRHGRLAFRARSARLTAADVDRARTEERSLVRMWLMRNTAHVIATDDLPWMRPLFAPPMEAFNRRRLGHFGLDANAQERALSVIKGNLARHGTLTRTELSAMLESAGIEMSSSRRAHLFPLAVSTGIAALGPGEGAGLHLVAAGDWLPHARDAERDHALAELARRYLRAFGPASDRDLAKWSGLPLRDARAGISAIASELREANIGADPGWVLRRPSRRPRAPVVRLLPAWDTYLMGYASRDFMTTPRRWRRVSGGGGMIAPTIVADGAIAGTWRPGRPGGPERAGVNPFSEREPELQGAVGKELADVARFEGLPG